MKNENTGKRLLCLLLAVCSILANINFNRLELRAEVNEKKMYMDYLAKVDKKWKKQMKQEIKENPYASGIGYVYYRMIDLDDDGRKELIYILSTGDGYCEQQLFICTIKKGEAHRVWKSEKSHTVSLLRVKGEKKKCVVVYGFNLGQHYDIYTFSSGKMKKVIGYDWHMDFGGEPGDFYYYNEDGKKVKEPSELKSNNLKEISFKEYK